MLQHLMSARVAAFMVLFAASSTVPAQVKPNVPAEAVLAAPAGVVLNFSAGDVIVAWNAAKGASGYEVMRTTDPLQPPAKIATLARTSLGYHDRGLGSDPVYFYQVVSIGADGARAASAFYKFTVPVRAAPVPGSAASMGLSAPAAAAPATPRGAIGLPATPPPATVPALGTPGSAVAKSGVSASTLTANTPCVAPTAPVPLGAPARLPQQLASATAPPAQTGLPLRQQSVSAPTANVPAGATVGNLAVATTTATTVALSWTCTAGASGYRIYQSVYGSAYNLVARLVQGVLTYTDSGLIPNLAYSYKVSADFPTGAGPLGEAVTSMTKPGLPPARLTAQIWPTSGTSVDTSKGAQLTPDSIAAASTVAVHLEWPAAPEAAGYLIFRDGTPLMQSTSPDPGLAYIDRAVPAGAHTYQVASIFRTAAQKFVEGELTGLPSATVPLSSGFYRLLLTQIIANRATNDTPLSLDGKGDEIYATADIFLVSSDAGVTPQQSLRSWTYGDINNQSDRARAGTLSDKGGIQSNDLIPGAIACGGTSPDHLCLPMEIFRGQLVKDALGVYVIPRVWEWDNSTDLFAAPLKASQKLVLQYLGTMAQQLRQKAIVQARQTGGYVPVLSGALFPTGDPWVPLSTVLPAGTTTVAEFTPLMLAIPTIDHQQDHPIGMHSTTGFKVAFDDNVIPLSYELAEALVSGSMRYSGGVVGELGIGEFPMTFSDEPAYEGVYTLVFRVQRCTSMAQC